MAREVLAGGLEVDGHLFPRGVETETPHYALHYDEKYYLEPFLYKRERWLADEGPEVEKARSVFCAFSIGPRGCVGKIMAYQELMIVIGRVLCEFEIKLDDRVSCKNALRGGRGVDNAQTSISSMTLSRVRAWDRECNFGQEGVLDFKRLMDSTATESIDICYSVL